MNPSAYTPALRHMLIGTLFCTLAAAGWYAFTQHPNRIFQRTKADFQQHWQTRIAPLYDTIYQLTIAAPTAWQADAQLCSTTLQQISQIDPTRLSQRYRAERQHFERQLHERLSQIQTWQTDPAHYNLGGALKATLVNPDFSMDIRLLQLEAQLREAPRYYAIAKSNLARPDSARTKLAIDKQLLGLRFIESELADSLQLANLSDAQHAAIATHTYAARLALKDYIAFCRSLLFEMRNAAVRAPTPE
ncbi:MAG TPA: hypothetical protein PKC76_15095 [Saprospiraceae bacterium]|nr:hypothetical protein [Saprospiraceae bacterium]HMP25460.1 hypothetical protein [Saprospiraceae bacterium]